MQAAAEEPTFNGELRRAIHDVRHTCGFFLPTLLERSGVNWGTLQPFLLGEAELPSGAIDRLVAVLGLHLKRETAATMEDAPLT